jgi:arginyl-tRNA synthetase
MNGSLREALEENGYDPDLASPEQPNQKSDVTRGVDLAMNAVSAAKAVGKHPLEAATVISESLGEYDAFESVDAVGPFVNMRFDYQNVAPTVLHEVATYGGHYGHFRGDEPKLS